MIEDEKIHLTRREMQIVELLMGFGSVLENEPLHSDIRQLLRDLDAKKQIEKLRCIENMNDRVLDAIYGRIPQEQLNHLNSVAKNSTVSIRVRGLAGANEHLTLIDDKELNDLAQYAIDGNCQLCIKFGKDAKRCKLRKVLSAYFPPEKRLRTDDCPYMHITLEE